MIHFRPKIHGKKQMVLSITTSNLVLYYVKKQILTNTNREILTRELKQHSHKTETTYLIKKFNQRKSLLSQQKCCRLSILNSIEVESAGCQMLQCGWSSATPAGANTATPAGGNTETPVDPLCASFHWTRCGISFGLPCEFKRLLV